MTNFGANGTEPEYLEIMKKLSPVLREIEEEKDPQTLIATLCSCLVELGRDNTEKHKLQIGLSCMAVSEAMLP